IQDRLYVGAAIGDDPDPLRSQRLEPPSRLYQRQDVPAGGDVEGEARPPAVEDVQQASELGHRPVRRSQAHGVEPMTPDGSEGVAGPMEVPRADVDDLLGLAPLPP